MVGISLKDEYSSRTMLQRILYALPIALKLASMGACAGLVGGMLMNHAPQQLRPKMPHMHMDPTLSGRLVVLQEGLESLEKSTTDANPVVFKFRSTYENLLRHVDQLVNFEDAVSRAPQDLLHVSDIVEADGCARRADQCVQTLRVMMQGADGNEKFIEALNDVEQSVRGKIAFVRSKVRASATQ